MKKNITINMCGRLYQIDEDACNLLQKYIESLRSSFGRKEGGDEIVDDIEARIAELFDELKKDGIEAITIDDVKAIISRIGEPEQLAGEEEKENAGEETRSAGQKMYDNFRSRTAGKRLFRNPKDKMIAGVLSGLAAYTNTDAVIWRIIAVILFFFYGVGLIAYIVLAIVVPVATTDEDFRQMHGEGTPQYESSRSRTSNRKLFRNPNDKMVAGVLSGLAAYTNTDVIIWRILAIVFTFFYGIGLIAYIVLAIILPEAITPEEKLQMRGREVNPQNLADAVTDKEPVRHHGLLASLFSVLLKIAIIFAVGIAVIIGIALCVVFLAVLVVLVAAISLPVDGDMRS
ncbi:MAG: PspC domain-containing protein, partial [Bacteroidaceae bacterium]|nr:PspC domain-containing protein [Bacteroidaceae bacterium]